MERLKWGGKWREAYKDYPETWKSGSELIIEEIMNKPHEPTLKEIIKKGMQQVFDQGYKRGVEDERKRHV